MNKKSLIKYYHDDEHGLMHYVVFEGEVVVLSELESKKVDYIEKVGKLNVTFDITSDKFEVIDVSIIKEQEYVGKVYNYMLNTNNAYFKDGYESLCVIKFKKN